MRYNLSITAVLWTCMFLTACAGLQKEQYFTCPYETVWDAAVDTMKDRPVVRKDKEGGVIETGWTEMAVDGRGFGAFDRQLFDSKERARILLELKPTDGQTRVIVAENRQRWHARGGVTQQAVKWSPVEPSQEAMNSVMTGLKTKAGQRGCPTP